MVRKLDMTLLLAACLIYAVFSSFALIKTEAAEQYVKDFDDFKIKEKKNPIPALTRDLQYNIDYINNPCLLSPTAEISPLMDIDELQRQYKETRKALLSQDQVEHSKQLYHKMVLEGYLLMACMIRVEFGNRKAEKIIDRWISGYDNPSFKQVIEDNLKSVLDIADSAVSAKQCRHWVVMATRYNEFQVPASTSTQSVFDYLTDKLSIGGGSLAKVGPYTGSIITRCLQTAPGLNKAEKDRIARLVGAGQMFTYQLIGAALSRLLGHHSSADLLRILAHELNRAVYLERDEVRKRVRFLVSGFKLSEICRKVKSIQDCLEAVEADFSVHTPHEDPPIPQLLQPALADTLKPKPLLDDKVDALLQNTAAKNPAKPAPKPLPNKAGANPLTHKVGQQPLTHKPGGDLPLNTKIGGDHPGVSVVGHPQHERIGDDHPLIHHISEDWPLDVHPEHLTSSSDELVNKVNALDNPLLTAIMENKNPELLKLLQDSGSPELLQTLLSSNMPIAHAEANSEIHEMSKKEKAKQRLRQLLAAFKGDKQKLAKAIKAHARIRLLSYLKAHKNSKLMQLMKTKYKEPLLAELDAHKPSQTSDHDHDHLLQHLVNFKEKPKTKSEKAMELLKLLEFKQGAHHTKIHPTELKPGQEILDELKDELSNLGFKHTKKPSQYIDNTLVHFGNPSFGGIGLPVDYPPEKIAYYGNRKGHRNPFQYEEDWKGSLWHSRRHHGHRLPKEGFHQDHPAFMHHIKETNEEPQSNDYPSASMRPGKQTDRIGSALIDDTAATLGNVHEDNSHRENLKAVFKDMAANGMDSHDVENLLSNLPGIVGHHVGKEEVNSIMSQFGKSEGKPVNSVTLNVGQENQGGNNDGQHQNDQQFIHSPQKPERIEQQISETRPLLDENQLGGGDTAALQKHLEPQKIIEEAEFSKEAQAGSHSPQMSEGGIGLPSTELQTTTGQESEHVIHIRPNQKVIDVNGYSNNLGSQGDGVLKMNSDQLFTNQGQNDDNYAGITENEDKPKVDLLNLNGKIQGIEGLDVQGGQTMQSNHNEDSDFDNGKTVENLLSSDAAPTHTDLETIKEMKEQQSFDAMSMANTAKALHHLSAVKPTTIDTNYLESFDNDDDNDQNQARVTQEEKPHDVINDYMDFIHKQDAVDEDYSRSYYKHGNNPLSPTSIYESDMDLPQYEKKSSLKNKDKKKNDRSVRITQSGNKAKASLSKLNIGVNQKQSRRQDRHQLKAKVNLQKMKRQPNDIKQKNGRVNSGKIQGTATQRKKQQKQEKMAGNGRRRQQKPSKVDKARPKIPQSGFVNRGTKYDNTKVAKQKQNIKAKNQYAKHNKQKQKNAESVTAKTNKGYFSMKSMSILR